MDAHHGDDSDCTRLDDTGSCLDCGAGTFGGPCDYCGGERYHTNDCPLQAAERLQEARGKGENLLVPPLPLGRTVATPGAVRALAGEVRRNRTRLGTDYYGIIPWEPTSTLLARHAAGDWGSVDAEDFIANEAALVNGSRVLSQYALEGGERVWIITEADRSSTTILLPEEY